MPQLRVTSDFQLAPPLVYRYVRAFAGPIGLTQTYRFEALSGGRTQLTVTYRWSWWTALSSFGRARHAAQAGIVGTVASLEALECEDVRAAFLSAARGGARGAEG